MMKVVVLLVLLTASGGVGSRVVGRTGDDVILKCTYQIRRHGALSVCWGRGQIPAYGCAGLFVSTDGRKVTKQTSRFQLRGQLEDGDVSLTILNVSQTDAGRYGCRVEIPGWLNDDKHHFDLVVERAPQTTSSSALTTETSTETNSQTGQTISTERPLTSSSSSVTAEESSGVNVVLLCVLFGLLALVTAGAVVCIASRRRRLNKIPHPHPHPPHPHLHLHPQQQVYTLSALQLQSRAAAVENIYQIDGGGDGGEYEYCP